VAKNRSKSRGGRSTARKSVALNPFIPAVPAKGRRGLLRPVLGVPLALIAGAAAASVLPARALTVPEDAARALLSAKDYASTVAASRAAVLRKFEGKSAFGVAQKAKGQQRRS